MLFRLSRGQVVLQTANAILLYIFCAMYIMKVMTDARLSWEVLNHPPYSHDVSLCDFAVFSKMPGSFYDSCFRTVNGILQCLHRWQMQATCIYYLYQLLFDVSYTNSESITFNVWDNYTSSKWSYRK